MAMKVNVVLGPNSSGKSEYVLKRVSELVTGAPPFFALDDRQNFPDRRGVEASHVFAMWLGDQLRSRLVSTHKETLLDEQSMERELEAVLPEHRGELLEKMCFLNWAREDPEGNSDGAYDFVSMLRRFTLKFANLLGQDQMVYFFRCVPKWLDDAMRLSFPSIARVDVMVDCRISRPSSNCRVSALQSDFDLQSGLDCLTVALMGERYTNYGSGVCAFINCLLRLEEFSENGVLAIDEPESFLGESRIRALLEVIITRGKTVLQHLFIITHSQVVLLPF